MNNCEDKVSYIRIMSKFKILEIQPKFFSKNTCSYDIERPLN